MDLGSGRRSEEGVGMAGAEVGPGGSAAPGEGGDELAGPADVAPSPGWRGHAEDGGEAGAPEAPQPPHAALPGPWDRTESEPGGLSVDYIGVPLELAPAWQRRQARRRYWAKALIVEEFSQSK